MKHPIRYFTLCTTLALVGNPASAADYVVTTPLDVISGDCLPSQCSLRDAIIAANKNPGPDTILVAPGTYQLTLSGENEDAGATGDLDITGEVNIFGLEGAPVVIDGVGLDRVFHIHSGAIAAIINMKIINGFQYTEMGGGILNESDLYLEAVDMENNISLAWGGAIQSRAPLNAPRSNLYIFDSNFTGNCAASGGAIDSSGGVQLLNTRFSANTPVSAAQGNCYSLDSGAVHVQAGEALIVDSTFDANQGAVGALSVQAGSVFVTRSAFTNNVGEFAGAIGNQWQGNVTVNNTTFSGNSGSDAAVINSASQQTTRIESATIWDNSSPVTGINRIDVYQAGPMEIVNTILGETKGAPQDCSGTITSMGYNIITNPGNCDITLQSTDSTNAPGLDALVVSSVPGGTHYPLLVDAYAIDKGRELMCSSSWDQLGTLRPLDGDGVDGARCDIGAIEAPVNLKPVAVNDRLVFPEDTTVTFHPLRNDTLGDAPTTLISVDTTSLNTIGSATINSAHGTITYTPAADMMGDDAFKYSIQDATGDISTATVSVSVIPVNDAPVADAGHDQSSSFKTSFVLDGSASYDVDTPIVSYHWQQTAGPAVKLKDPSTVVIPISVQKKHEGSELRFQLTVTDVMGATGVDEVVITVVPTK